MTAPVEDQVHRSYSQLNQYRRCGEQFRLERIEHAPQRPGVAAVAGTVIHVATEHMDRLLLDRDLLAEEEYDQTAGEELLRDVLTLANQEFESQESYWTLHGYPPGNWRTYGRQDANWFRLHGVPQALGAYLEWRVEHKTFKLANLPDHGPAIEVPFNVQFENGLQVHGHIDRVFFVESSAVLVPVDIKSGRRPKTDEQLGLYARAIEATYHRQVDWGFYIYDLKSGTARLSAPMRVSHWSWPKLEKVYQDLDRALQAEIYIPHPGEECFHCAVSDSCLFAQSVV